MSFDPEMIPRAEILAAIAPGLAVDVAHDGLVKVRCFWPGCAAANHKHGDNNPSAALNPKRGTFICKINGSAKASGWRQLVTACLGVAAWERYRAAGFPDGGAGARSPRPLAEVWAGLERELRWTELYRIDHDLSARYLRAGRRLPGEQYSDSAVGIHDAAGALVGVKFRLPAGKVWKYPPKDGSDTDKYLCTKGSAIAGVVFLADRAREGATVVVCAGEKDALVAASHLDPARWAPVSGCVGECAGRVPAKWRDAITTFCHGRDVVIAYDGDASGHHGAWRLARALEGAAKSVRAAVMPLPEELTPPKGEERWDVAAYVLERQGAALEQLLLAAGPVPASWEPPPPPGGIVDRDAKPANALPGVGPGAPGPGGPPPPRPRALEIVLTERIGEMADQAEAALAASDLERFHRAAELVRIVTLDGRPRIAPLPRASLVEDLARVATWIRIRETKEGQTKDPVKPDGDAVEALMARAAWPRLRELRAVVDCPTLRPDGTVCQAPGYDAGSRVLYVPSVPFPRVLERPTIEEARAALATIEELFCDFPFVADSDRSAAVALILTVVGRAVIDGPSPLFAARAPAAGTGKTKIVDVAAAIALGLLEAPRLGQPDSDEETEKQFVSFGRDGMPLALFDNLDKPLGNAVLARALTSRTFSGRLLGKNVILDVPMPVLAATGNNLQVAADLHRRVLPIDLAVEVENPEERVGFRFPHLIPHVLANRPQLLVAALTCLRWWHAEGRPVADLSPWGSYEAWSFVIRNVLIYLGRVDPCAGRARIREESDPEREALGAFLAAWHEAVGDRGLPVCDLLDMAKRRPELRDALIAVDTRWNPELLEARNTVAQGFKKRKGRIVGGLRLEQLGVVHGGKHQWRVVKVERPVAHAAQPADPDAWQAGRE